MPGPGGPRRRYRCLRFRSGPGFLRASVNRMNAQQENQARASRANYYAQRRRQSVVLYFPSESELMEHRAAAGGGRVRAQLQ